MPAQRGRVIALAVVVAAVAAAIIGAVLIQDGGSGNDESNDDSNVESELPTLPADLTLPEWQSLNGPPGAGRVNALVQNPQAPYELFASTANGVYESKDKGESWNLLEATRGIGEVVLATAGGDLYVCSDLIGVLKIDAAGNSTSFFEPPCRSLGFQGDQLYVGFDGGRQAPVEVFRTEIGGANAEWDDISPAPDVFDDLVRLSPETGLNSYYEVSNIVARGDSIVMGVTLTVEGSGEFSSGFLYASGDGGETWSAVETDTPADVVVTKLIQDPEDADHLLALFRHPILHEVRYPVSEMVRESFDAGRTWERLTELMQPSNGILDAVIDGETYYLTSPYDGYLLKLRGTEYETFNAPSVEEFAEVNFPLETILFDPENPEVVYGKPGKVWELGLVKSVDGMKTWRKMDGDIVASSPTIVVADPSDPDTLYTASNIIQESYATRDDGASWDPFTPVNAGDEIRIDPHDPDHMLLVDELTRIFESFDGGRTFRQITQDFSGAKIFDFEVAAKGPDLIYVSNAGVGISRLRSGDPEWHYMTNSPDYAYDIEIDPDDNDVLFAAYSPKKFESHGSVWRYSPEQPEAFGWQEILRVEGSGGITALEFDPSNSHRLYAGSVGANGTIYVSKNKGATWDILNPALTFTTIRGHSQLQVNPADKNTILAGTWGGGTYRSSDGGANWTRLDDDHTFSATCLAFSQTNPNVVYACDRTAAKIHKSEDGGETWQEYFDFGGDHLLTAAIAIDPNDDNVIYASAFRPPAAMLGSLLKMEDGEQVADLSNGLPRAVLDIEVDEQNPETLYVTTHLHGLFRSIDGGDSWVRFDDRGAGLPRTGYLDVESDPLNGDVLYAASLCGAIPDYVFQPIAGLLGQSGSLLNIDATARCGLYKSTNGGASWSMVLETQGSAAGLDIDDADPDNIYVADSSGGIWVSNDAGSSWRQENAALTSTTMTSVKVRGDAVYAGTHGSGVYAGVVKDDGSITWDLECSNAPRAYVYKMQIEVDPNDPQRIYASAYPGGVLRSDDGGATWHDKNFLTPSIRVIDPAVQGYYAFDIDPSDPETVWLGVYGKGMIVSRDGRDFGLPADGEDGVMRGKHITSVRVDPTDSNSVYVGAEEGVFFTTDAGRSWQQINEGLHTTDIRSLRIVSGQAEPFQENFADGNAADWELDPGWSLVAQDGDFALQGVGHQWARAGSTLWQDYTLETRLRLDEGAVHVNARVSDEGRYFVGINEGGLYLQKQFNEWSEFADLADSSGSVAPGVWHDLRIDVSQGDIVVYFDGIRRLSYSDPDPIPPGAIAFESLDDSLVRVDDVSVKLAHGADSVVYAGTGGYGVYRLDSSTQSWRNLGRTLGSGWWSPWERRMYQFSSLRFDPDVAGRVYFGHFPGGFYVSEDAGHTWQDSSLGLGNDGTFSLWRHPTEGKTLYAGTYNGVVRSNDGGRTWSDLSNGMPSEQWPYTVAINPVDPNVMYTSTKNGQNKGFCHRNEFCGVVMKSDDGGDTWSEIMTGLDPRSEYYSIVIYPEYPDLLFLSSSNGVYWSRNAGKSWEPINDGLPTTFNQVRDNVAENLTLTADHASLILGLAGYGAWSLDLSFLQDD